MNSVDTLKKRMVALSLSLDADPDALALLGLGSAGIEEDRLDEWSDLDFFVIVREGAKARFLADPAWLSAPKPVAYLFKNTNDGYKLLWEDGIFGEMAVFEPGELAGIPYAEGKVWWCRDGFDAGILAPHNAGGHAWTPPSPEFCAGELITCLYVGLCRWNRGERLSAWRFVQGYCLDRVLELAEFWEAPSPGARDPYNRDRRLETRYPSVVPLLEKALLGYARVPEAAMALLEWLETKMTVNRAMAAEIRKLSGV